MSIVYFDSSAFVKLLVEEHGSELAAALWDGCDAAVSSRLGYPEVRPTGRGRRASAGLLAVGAADTLFAVGDTRLRAGAAAVGVNLAPPG